MTDFPPPIPYPIAASGPTKDERTWAMIAHFSQFLAFVGIPGAGIVGPLVVYFARSESPFVRRHAKQALAFHVGLLVIVAALTIFAFLTCGFGAILAVPLGIVLAVMGVIYPIVAGMRANDGGEYVYPLTGGFVS